MSMLSPYSNHEIQAFVHNCLGTVNKHFKQWGVLVEVWRQAMHAHSTIFHAITALTYLGILIREPIIDVNCTNTVSFNL